MSPSGYADGMPEHAARTALQALVERAAEASPFVDLPRLPTGGDARAAAVLILFGVLDEVRSTARAEASAVTRDLDLLLLARATTLRAHPGQVAFPGGRVDPGDAGAVDAALREAREETGLDPAGVDVLGELPRVPLDFSGHIVTPVLGWWHRPSPVRVVDEAESAAVFRVPVADLLDPARRGSTVIRRAGRTWRGPGFLVRAGDEDLLLWGFTGMIVDALFDELGWTEPWDASRELPLPA